eukprot:TRINITY_DN56734_c0_g1_i1.p1 TRINITY_DN56734_c0_g1~~TRINITY_DN56734_c0_g1_i1.p1  ORF type:complete len:318 (+),score=104.92 TRINITY_DN56734_c0_g1_i1:72-1025(+)
METVEKRLAEAQASGDLNKVRAALADARAAGADPAHIDEALREVDQLERQRAAGAAPSSAQAAPAAAAPDAAEAAQAREKADALKRKGNEALKGGTKSAAKEAFEFFTAGLEAGCSDAVLIGQLYSNRAHVRILLRQFVEAVDDCRKAIASDPKNLKAYWRAAKASLHLDLCRNGVDFCEAGLRQEPKDADLMKLRETCAEKLAGLQRRRAEAAAAAPVEFNADEAMALQERVDDLNEQCATLQATLAGKQRLKHSKELTRTTIKELPESAGTFLSVGRCFLKAEKRSVEEILDRTIGELDEELPKLTKAREEMESR